MQISNANLAELSNENLTELPNAKFIEILSANTVDFNEKTVNSELAVKMLKNSKFLRKLNKFTFLPMDYLIFIQTYLEYPDIFIKFPTYGFMKSQYIKNILKKREPFELLYRCYSYKSNVYKLSMTWLSHYAIVFCGKEIYIGTDMATAFEVFMTYNYKPDTLI
jgi:hypothetical protein